MAADVVDGDDVGVIQCRGEARLALEALDDIGVVHQARGEQLHRHLATQLLIVGDVDRSMPPSPTFSKKTVERPKSSSLRCTAFTEVSSRSLTERWLQEKTRSLEPPRERRRHRRGTWPLQRRSLLRRKSTSRHFDSSRAGAISRKTTCNRRPHESGPRFDGTTQGANRLRADEGCRARRWRLPHRRRRSVSACGLSSSW